MEQDRKQPSHTVAELTDELTATRRALEIARESERRFRILNELTNDY